MAKILQLYYQLKDSKLIIYLYKENHGREWNDIRLKTTRDVYDELQRAEGKGAVCVLKA